VVLEALAMGLPVISTRQNGACEIMIDRLHGVILDEPDDLAALSEALRRMLDTGTRQRMTDAVLDLRQALSHETHVANLLGIYHRALSERRRAAAGRD
jgi:UDP-glucose:(heptosyl)LPS alpha-1,3-glucosyltransferase